jgi:pimeloyl-ACP methyl ester carboxylesterase
MSRVTTFLCALVLALAMWAGGVAAAPTTPPAKPAPLPQTAPPGMTEHKLREPIFHGEAWVYEAGRGKARSILLVHGLGDAGARDWNTVVPWLAQDYHVVSVDLPGFARSTKANVTYTPTTYAQFLKQVVEKFVPRPFVLMGHSMGAVVALRYSVTYPADVERLILVDSPGILHRASFSSHLLAHLGIDFLPRGMDPASTLGSWSRRILARAERLSVDPEIVLHSPSLREQLLGGDPTKIAGLGLVLEDFSASLATLAVPTLLVWGEQDTLAPPRIGKVLHALLPQSRLAVIPRAAHVPMEETPAEFRVRVEPFIRDGSWPAASAVVAPVTAARGIVRCENRRGAVYEGEFDTLILKRCDGAKIRRATIKQLRVFDSAIEIEDSRIDGGDYALHAHDATVVMTGGAVRGKTAFYLLGSTLDLAAVEVTATRAAATAPVDSSIVFSVSRLHGPNHNGPMHGAVSVGPAKGL